VWKYKYVLEITISTKLKGYFVKKTIDKVKEEMQKKKEKIKKYIFGIFKAFIYHCWVFSLRLYNDEESLCYYY